MSDELHIDDAATRAKAVRTLSGGGVIVLPTDTLYGLSTLISNDAGIERISHIKGTGSNRRFLFIASSIAMVEDYAAPLDASVRSALSAVWPAPLTAILTSGPKTPAWVGPTVAVRVPDLESLRAIVEELGESIVSTSVNRRGVEPLTSVSRIQLAFGGEVDMIVAGIAANRSGKASTIVDFTAGEPKVVREGSYEWTAGDSKPSN